jgi:hypothetical protein
MVSDELSEHARQVNWLLIFFLDVIVCELNKILFDKKFNSNALNIYLYSHRVSFR